MAGKLNGGIRQKRATSSEARWAAPSGATAPSSSSTTRASGSTRTRRAHSFYAEFPRIKTVRTPACKLVYYPGAPYGELYDLRNDPHELENLWAVPGRAAARHEMMARLSDWLIASHDPLPPPVPAPEVR